MSTDAKAPDCYKCQHRANLPGSTHSSCQHPKVASETTDPLGQMMAIFASVGRVEPVIGPSFADLGIQGNAHGIKKGWFNWPWNFDPVWLDSCSGFEPKEPE